MSEVAVRETYDIAPQPHTDSWIAVVADVAQLASRISGTEMVPESLRDNPAAVTAAILYGREIGLPPMTALRSVYVVHGAVAVRAETMRGLILAAGHEIFYDEATGAKCVARGRRKGSERFSSVEWTQDGARAAGLLRNPSWTRYPRAMLKARATAELARDLFADVISGFVALEEVEGVEVDGDDEPKPARRRRVQAQIKGQTTVEDQLANSAEETAAPAEPVAPQAETATEEHTQDASAPLSPVPAAPTSVPLPGEDGYEDLGTAATPVDVVSPGRSDTSQWQTYPAQRTKLHATFTDLGVTDRELRLDIASLIVGRPLASSDDLTRGEAGTLIDTLTLIQETSTLRAALTDVVHADDPRAALADVGAYLLGRESEPTDG